MAVFQDEIKVLERLSLDNGLGVSFSSSNHTEMARHTS